MEEDYIKLEKENEDIIKKVKLMIENNDENDDKRNLIKNFVDAMFADLENNKKTRHCR